MEPDLLEKQKEQEGPTNTTPTTTTKEADKTAESNNQGEKGTFPLYESWLVSESIYTEEPMEVDPPQRPKTPEGDSNVPGELVAS